MARTYDPALLAAPDVSSLAWALAWVRMALRDTPVVDQWPDGSYLDSEIEGQLVLTAVTGPSGPLYAPHVAAASLVEGDPRRALALKADDISEVLPDASKVAVGIRRSGRAIDKLISAAGGMPPGRVRMETVF